MKAVYIKCDGTRTGITPKNGIDFSLEELQKYVGGYIEIINVFSQIMIIDDEGKLKGKEINPVATQLARTSQSIMPNDCIVGDVVVCETEMVK